MSQSVVVTARIDGELAERLDRLAAEYDRRRGWMVAQAIERYVAEESALLQMVREGEADLEAGRSFTQEQVEEMFGVTRQVRRDAA